ncbi:MAG: type 4a pilus biogenesis protein PilO [Candidatus Daviesbacteria bacterium]|nr:type 4a pilus biogenesis protein PilO [Candidatus Daviesbacteria bacterium]
MNKSEIFLKYKFFVWPIIVGISSIVVLVLVIIPQLLTYLNINEKINQVQNRSNTLETKAVALENVDNLLTQKDLKVVFSVLPVDQDVPQAMVVLQDMVAKSGLELKSTSFGSSGLPQKGAGNSSFRLNIAVSGQVNVLRDFLVQLQNLPRLFQVDSIGVQFQKDKGVIEAEIPLSVFYNPTLGEMGTVDDPLPQINDKDKELLAKLTQVVGQGNNSWASQEATSASTPLGKSDPFE